MTETEAEPQTPGSDDQPPDLPAPSDPESPDWQPEDPGADEPGPSDDDATSDGDTDDGDDGESSPDSQPAPPSAPDTAGQLERVTNALFKAAKNYGKRVAEIFGDDWLGCIPCPCCAQDFPGVVTPAPRNEDAIAATRALIGLPDLSTYVEDRFARQCERCQGRGKTLTGSRVPEYATIRCKQCNGTGFTSAEQGFELSNGATAPAVLPAPTHEDTPPVPAMSPDALDALEKMLNAGRNALAAQ